MCALPKVSCADGFAAYSTPQAVVCGGAKEEYSMAPRQLVGKFTPSVPCVLYYCTMASKKKERTNKTLSLVAS